jgi:predicted Zn finger-like uncharacterized protein
VQANCPQCTQKIVIDDARVPERAFSVKCPKCQTTVRFPGRTPAGAAAPAPAAAPAAAPPAAPASEPSFGEPAAFEAQAPIAVTPLPAGPEEVMRTQIMAQLRREMTLGGDAPSGGAGRAMVALPDRALAGTVTVMLSRQGYAVDTIEDWDEAARLTEQGLYQLILTTRTPAAQGKENVYSRIGRLSSENRRRLFLILVGDDLKSGDGLQAFITSCDLVLNTRDAGAADALLRSVVQGRTRLYQVYNDARARHEAAGV